MIHFTCFQATSEWRISTSFHLIERRDSKQTNRVNWLEHEIKDSLRLFVTLQVTVTLSWKRADRCTDQVPGPLQPFDLAVCRSRSSLNPLHSPGQRPQPSAERELKDSKSVIRKHEDTSALSPACPDVKSKCLVIIVLTSRAVRSSTMSAMMSLDSISVGHSTFL